MVPVTYTPQEKEARNRKYNEALAVVKRMSTVPREPPVAIQGSVDDPVYIGGHPL